MHIDRLTSRALLAACLLMAVLSRATAAGGPAQAPADEALLPALRGGGHTLYFRHAATDWSQQDKVAQRDDWLSCDPARMRQLSERGRDIARRLGAAIRRLQIPVARVLASPYCRTIETARLMRIGEVEPSEAVINLRVADYFGGRAAIVSRARALLAQPPPAGANTVIVAHGNVARDATPVYPGEGEGVVFVTDERNGFRVVGRLTPDAWQRLPGHEAGE